MELGSSKEEILEGVGSIVEQNLGQLKEGYNTIKTKMNGTVALIKAFVKDGAVISLDAMKESAKNARKTDNLIDLTKP